MEGVLPAGGTKQAGSEEKLVGRGRGVGREKQTNSSPGLQAGRSADRFVLTDDSGKSHLIPFRWYNVIT